MSSVGHVIFITVHEAYNFKVMKGDTDAET